MPLLPYTAGRKTDSKDQGTLKNSKDSKADVSSVNPLWRADAQNVSFQIFLLWPIHVLVISHIPQVMHSSNTFPHLLRFLSFWLYWFVSKTLRLSFTKREIPKLHECNILFRGKKVKKRLDCHKNVFVLHPNTTACFYHLTSIVSSKDYRNCFSSHPSSELSSSINSFGSSELLPGNGEVEPTSEPLSNSVPSTIESNLIKFSAPTRPISVVALSPPASNPVPIRGSHHRMRHSISAPSSANASPSGSLHGSPRTGSWFQRMRSSNSTCSHGSTWYGK